MREWNKNKKKKIISQPDSRYESYQEGIDYDEDYHESVPREEEDMEAEMTEASMPI